MKRYDLIIITAYPFPYGLASTNRIMTYAKAIANYKKVLVLSFSQTDYKISGDKFIKGTIDNVDYEYLRPIDPKNKNIVTKIYYRVITFLNYIFKLLFIYRTESIISYFHDYIYTRFLFVISHVRGYNIYKDITETFEGYFGSESARKRQRKLQAGYDGLIVMTDGIRDYFQGINNNTFILPMGVDVSRFEGIVPSEEKYFFYCSGGVLERDGVLDAIEAFVKFNKHHKDYKFKIATPININDEYHKKVLYLINNNDDIEYLGIIESNKIPQLMLKSTGLVLTPHHDYITKGFPTKLGEYLASGKPVICTSIKTLKESVPEGCSFMVSPNCPDEIAQAMETIVDEHDKAMIIAQKGKRFVVENYTIHPYLNDLLRFIRLV